MRARLAASAAALIVAAVGVAGCGDDKKSGSQSSAKVTVETTGKLPISTDLSKKPKVPPLTGLPPEKLTTQDVVVGTGKAAKAGDTVEVQYVGVAHSTDKQFDTSWDGKKPFKTALSKGAVIDGWVKGIPGMKEGGRRVLIIPPSLGYGATGSPPAIAPYETLVFVVDLKKVG